MTSASATSTAPIKDEGDIVPVRQAAREAAAAAGFTLVQQTKLVTAASELARNALVHGGGGQAEIFAGASGVRMVFRDSGPGIADIEQAAGLDRLAEAVRAAANLPGEDAGDLILSHMLGDDEHEDDVCLLLCRWTGPEPAPCFANPEHGKPGV